jgi:cation-transporting P-type ATPase E
VLHFAIPAGLCCAAATFIAYEFARANPISNSDVDRSAATLALFLVAFTTLALVARPYTAWRIALLTAMAGAFAIAVTMRPLAAFATLTFHGLASVIVPIGCGIGGSALLVLIEARQQRTANRTSMPPSPTTHHPRAQPPQGAPNSERPREGT